MKLIVGLGNPGEKYKNNRHNVGFMVVDEFARLIVNGRWLMVKKFQSLIINHESSIMFAKPQTFMNESGIAIKKLVVQYKIKTPDLWVIHDDLDLKLGSYKIQKGKGPKLHNGVNSIERELGNWNFWRVRIGIDNRMPNAKWPMLNGKKISGEQYVLQDFTKEELEILERTIDNVVEELLTILS